MKDKKKIPFNVLQDLMDEKETTLYKLAKETGIPPTVLYDWKSGRCQPKVDKMMILAKHFDVPLETFLA